MEYLDTYQPSFGGGGGTGLKFGGGGGILCDPARGPAVGGIGGAKLVGGPGGLGGGGSKLGGPLPL